MGRNDIRHFVTETERWSVINGMRTAAEVCKTYASQFDEIAEALRSGIEVAGFAAGEDGARAATALAWQFRRQHEDYGNIADLVEEAPAIAVMHEEDNED